MMHTGHVTEHLTENTHDAYVALAGESVNLTKPSNINNINDIEHLTEWNKDSFGSLRKKCKKKIEL